MMAIIILLAAFASPALAQTNTGNVWLGWSYSSNTLCASQTNGWPLSFRIYATNSLAVPLTNWPCIYNEPWTDAEIIGYDGTNWTFRASISVTPPGQMFFVATASNFWGETATSNLASVPSVAAVLKPVVHKE